MPIVTFVSQNKKIEIEAGKTIAMAAHDAGIYIETPCGETGSCGKCNVKVLKKDQPEQYLPACQTKVYEDIEVDILDVSKRNESMKILSGGSSKEVELKPAYHKEYRDGETKVFSQDKIMGIEQGDTTDKLYGIAVDIGTTTLVCALIDCQSKKEIAVVSQLNPQCRYAQDVVSRIQYTNSSPQGLQTLFNCITQTFNEMIKSVCDKAEIESKYIYEAVYSGNTTMLHIAVNVNPYSLGKYPYTSMLKGGETISAKKLGLQISSFGRIYVPPIVSAYVGADITSGILASDLFEQAGSTLFIDIGTNGEMILASNGDLTATSTAAGPAFEGMNISCGMRAECGAVESFAIDEKGTVNIKTIDDGDAAGICGSGLFDITAELIKAGVIQNSGRFVKTAPESFPENISKRLKKLDEKTVFEAAHNVYLTQLDIRQIQLAKSAIRSGIEAMSALTDMPLEKVDRVYIAGSFGYHLREKSLINMGIIPKEMRGKITFTGNTSKTGAAAFLLNTDCREYMEQRAKEIKVIELSDYEGFEQLFVKCMSFK